MKIDGSKRWICNVPKCNASLHTNEKGELIKMNNVSFDKFTDVRSFHAHDALNDNDLNKLKNWQVLKEKAATQSGSVMGMFEEETLRLAKEGVNDEDIARGTYQYTEKASSMYRRKWKNYPHLPKDLESLVFENEKYKQTY